MWGNSFQNKWDNAGILKGYAKLFCEELVDLADPFIVSTSLVNLQRLGLIKITESGLSGEDYGSIKEHPYVLARKEIFNQFGREFICVVNQRAVLINNYGEQFARVCLQKDI